jgi:hypothetical protein
MHVVHFSMHRSRQRGIERFAAFAGHRARTVDETESVDFCLT